MLSDEIRNALCNLSNYVTKQCCVDSMSLSPWNNYYEREKGQVQWFSTVIPPRYLAVSGDTSAYHN